MKSEFDKVLDYHRGRYHANAGYRCCEKNEDYCAGYYSIKPKPKSLKITVVVVEDEK